MLRRAISPLRDVRRGRWARGPGDGDGLSVLLSRRMVGRVGGVPPSAWRGLANEKLPCLLGSCSTTGHLVLCCRWSRWSKQDEYHDHSTAYDTTHPTLHTTHHTLQYSTASPLCHPRTFPRSELASVFLGLSRDGAYIYWVADGHCTFQRQPHRHDTTAFCARAGSSKLGETTRRVLLQSALCLMPRN